MGGGRKGNNSKDGKTSVNINNKNSQQDAHNVETRIEVGESSDTAEPPIKKKGNVKPVDETEVSSLEEVKASNTNDGAKNADSTGNTNCKQFQSTASSNEATETNFRNGEDTVENLMEKGASAQAVFSSNSIPTNPKTDPNVKTDLFHQTAANISSNVEEPAWTATVFIAAPLVKNHFLAITGDDKNLGKWKHPQGKFEAILEINKDLYIFKGIVPIPSINSPFKFVNVSMTDQNIEYEGEGHQDNRREELLPDSWNFFFFKPKRAKSMMGKVWEGLAKYMHKSETKEKIAEEFYHIVFNSTLENVLPDWDAAFEFVNDSLYKIKQQTEFDCFIVGFRQFLHKWLQQPELLVNFDKLFLLIIGASLMEVYLPRLKGILVSVSKEFSPYLLRLQYIRRNRDKFFGVLERIALNAGSDYWWILFRLSVLFNRQSEALRRFNQRQVTESIFKTLQENPEILLTNLECATRVVDYLVRWNEIDELYSNLRPVFKQKENYQYFLGPLLLRRLLICKTSLDDLKRILRSDFVRIAWQGWPCEEAALLTSPNETALCDEDIKTIFNQKLVDVVKLACGTPDYLLPVVVPVVETIVCQKLQTISNLSMEEYRYFAQLEDTGFNNFPQAKQEIETRLLKMTRDHLKSGSFQDVPSTKLILLVLAERKDIPFLDRR